MRDLRGPMQTAAAASFKAVIERASGRRVIAFAPFVTALVKAG